MLMSCGKGEVAHRDYLEAGLLNIGGLLRSRRHAIFGDRGGWGVGHWGNELVDFGEDERGEPVSCVKLGG